MLASIKKIGDGTWDRASVWLPRLPPHPVFCFLFSATCSRKQPLFVTVLLLGLLSACNGPGLPSDMVDSSQGQVETTLQLDAPTGQTFVAHHAGLRALDLYLQPGEQLVGASTLYLRDDMASATPLRTATLPAEQVTAPGFYRFEFAPLQASHGRTYYAELEGVNIQVGIAATDRYANGELYLNGALQAGDLAFREVYDQQAILLDLFYYSLTILRYLVLTLFLYVLPGYALLAWLWRGPALTWEEKFGLGAGITLAFYPVLLLWLYIINVQPGPIFAWAPGLIGLVVWLRDVWRTRTQWATWRFSWAQASRCAFIAVSLLIVLTRLIPIRTMPAPAWGDSVHHTMITQLILDHGGLFQTWAPYAPIQSFTYHFGLHAALANWAWLSGMDATQSVLVGSQMLNVLAVLALYPVAVRLAGGNRWAGVAAILVAGLLSSMPSFYVNWGRYTQLSGQIVLPVSLWAFDLWWVEKKRPDYRMSLLIALLATGVVLNHYRIGLIFGAAGLAWTLWGAWLHRQQPGEWLMRMLGLAGAALLAVVLIGPWVMIIQAGKLPSTYAMITARSTSAATVQIDLVAWQSMDLYYPRLLWVGAGLALLFAFWKARTLAWPLLLWGLFVFFATNPFLLNLPGTGWVTNFLVVIGFYIPLALAAGWGLGMLWQWLEGAMVGRILLILSLTLAAGWGAWQQIRIIDPFYQMVTPADQRAYAWIRANTPADARFLVNGFLAYYNSVVVGSDGGWWLSLYTQRFSSVPPISYVSETLAPDVTREQLKALEVDVRESQGDPAILHSVLCRDAITHVYIGERQGQVGFETTPLLPAAWLSQNDDFSLLFQAGHAQIWGFDQTQCP